MLDPADARWAGVLEVGQARGPGGKHWTQHTVEDRQGQRAERQLSALPTGRDLRAVAAQDVARGTEQAVQRGKGLTQGALTRTELNDGYAGHKLHVQLPRGAPFGVDGLPDTSDLADEG